MLLKLTMLSAIIFMPIIAGCGTFDNLFEKNYSLDSVASFDGDITELKKIWFFCEKCLNNELCESYDVKQCKDVTIPSRSEALSKAVGRANTEAVYFLVDVAETDVNEVTGEYKETPLIIAAYYGTKKHQDIAEFLLSRGADINQAYPAVGRNALGIANWKHNIDFAEFLLKHGAEPSAVIHREESLSLYHNDH
ncbi:ankyrin repeat domain-containing protein [Salmonella enterica subsp. salamae]|uniref:Ankyrin repeat domain-containing protein n=2 Tax=Salmonella enterica subsp. salamae TaxID=59202 RepID=A0A701W1U7_SALER|nr:ankyrin repeat domain-containing protein [Salmonella enterica]ECW5365906.1 ankyrin repeat domain-containing protein [Salmonella enterica subsp. salamae]HAC6415016.1 ankyrin repeat domain-containing protein [Salmonella enterica subsp. salamae serovar 58:a:-]HAE8257836.1 ankyrin repeat domain-containing protein [Salmonella enterica subsp. salamae serovar 42:b:1,5]HCM1869305.1 ankyrin repeat domain-containing protein [Salmonella enterica subsp. salamae serovar 58:a:z6]